jgi:hypothetical protein
LPRTRRCVRRRHKLLGDRQKPGALALIVRLAALIPESFAASPLATRPPRSDQPPVQPGPGGCRR